MSESELKQQRLKWEQTSPLAKPYQDAADRVEAWYKKQTARDHYKLTDSLLAVIEPHWSIVTKDDTGDERIGDKYLHVRLSAVIPQLTKCLTRRQARDKYRWKSQLTWVPVRPEFKYDPAEVYSSLWYDARKILPDTDEHEWTDGLGGDVRPGRVHSDKRETRANFLPYATYGPTLKTWHLSGPRRGKHPTVKPPANVLEYWKEAAFLSVRLVLAGKLLPLPRPPEVVEFLQETGHIEDVISFRARQKTLNKMFPIPHAITYFNDKCYIRDKNIIDFEAKMASWTNERKPFHAGPIYWPERYQYAPAIEPDVDADIAKYHREVLVPSDPEPPKFEDVPIPEDARDELDREFRAKHRPSKYGDKWTVIADPNTMEDSEDWEQNKWLKECKDREVKKQVKEKENVFKVPGEVEKPPVKIEQHWVGRRVLLPKTEELDAIRKYREETDNENDKHVLDYMLSQGILSFDAFNYLEFIEIMRGNEQASQRDITPEQARQWAFRCHERLADFMPEYAPNRKNKAEKTKKLSEVPALADLIAHRIVDIPMPEDKSYPGEGRLEGRTKDGEFVLRHQGYRHQERLRQKMTFAGLGGLTNVGSAVRHNTGRTINLTHSNGQPFEDVQEISLWHEILRANGGKWSILQLDFEIRKKSNRYGRDPLTLTAWFPENNGILGRIPDMDRYEGVEINLLLDALLFYKAMAVVTWPAFARKLSLAKVIRSLVIEHRDKPGFENAPALLDKPIKLTVNLGLGDKPDWHPLTTEAS